MWTGSHGDNSCSSMLQLNPGIGGAVLKRVGSAVLDEAPIERPRLCYS